MKAFKRVTALLVAVMMVMGLCTVSVSAADQRTLRVDVSDVAGGIAVGDTFEVSYYAAALDGDTKVTTVTFEVPYDNAKLAVTPIDGGITTASLGTTTGGDPCFKVFAFSGSGYADFNGGAEVLVAKVKVTVLDGSVAEELSFMPDAPVLKCNNEAGNKDFDNKVDEAVVLADKTKTLTSAASVTSGVKAGDTFTVSYAFDNKGQNVTNVSFEVDYDETKVSLESSTAGVTIADGKLTYDGAATTIDGITATVLDGAAAGDVIDLNATSASYKIDGIDASFANVTIKDGIGAATKVKDAFDVLSVEAVAVDTYSVGTDAATIIDYLNANVTEVTVNTAKGDKVVAVANWQSPAGYSDKKLDAQTFTATLVVDGVFVTNSTNEKAAAAVTLQPLTALDATPVIGEITVTQKIPAAAYDEQEVIDAVKARVGAITVTNGTITDVYETYAVAVGADTLENENDTTDVTITLSGASKNGLFNLATDVEIATSVKVGASALSSDVAYFEVNNTTAGADGFVNNTENISINVVFNDTVDQEFKYSEYAGKPFVITATASTGEEETFTFYAPYFASTVVCDLGAGAAIFGQAIEAGATVDFSIILNGTNQILTEDGQMFATVQLKPENNTKYLTIETTRTGDNESRPDVAEVRIGDEFDITYTLTDDAGNDPNIDSINMEIDYDTTKFEIVDISWIDDATPDATNISFFDGKVRFVIEETAGEKIDCAPVLTLHVKVLSNVVDGELAEFAPELVKYTHYTATGVKPDLTIYDDVEIVDTTGIEINDKFPVVDVADLEGALAIQEELGNNLVYGKTEAEILAYLEANYNYVTILDPGYKGAGYELGDQIEIAGWEVADGYTYDMHYQGVQRFQATLVENDEAYNPNGIIVYADLTLSPIMPTDIYMTNLPDDYVIDIEEDPYTAGSTDEQAIFDEIKRLIGDDDIVDDKITVNNGVANTPDTYDYANVTFGMDATYDGSFYKTFTVDVSIDNMSDGLFYNAVPTVTQQVQFRLVPYVITEEINWEANPNPTVGTNDTVEVTVNYVSDLDTWQNEPVSFIVIDNTTGKVVSVQNPEWIVPGSAGTVDYELGNLEYVLGYVPSDLNEIEFQMMVGDNPVAYSYDDSYNVLENKVLGQIVTVSTPLVYGDGNDDGIIDTYEDIDAIVNHYLEHKFIENDRVAAQMDVTADYNESFVDATSGHTIREFSFEDINAIIDHYLEYLPAFDVEALNPGCTMAGHLAL